MAETHKDPRSRLDESESDDEEQEKGADILEVHNEWEKRGREIPQSETPGVDRAYVALDQNSGIEVVWHEVDLKFRKTQTDLERTKIISDVKTITKMFTSLINLDHPNIVNFKDYWINYRERNAGDSNQNTWNSNKFSKDELIDISSGAENDQSTENVQVSTVQSTSTTAQNSQNPQNSQTLQNPQNGALLNQNSQNSQTSNLTNSQYSTDQPKWEVLIPKGDEEFGKTLDSILVEYNGTEFVAYKDVIFRLVFITEYMNHGSLSDFLQSCQTKSKLHKTKEKGIQLWCSQVLGAIAYLHSYAPPIIHANLSCETIFRHHNGQLKIGSIALDIIRKHVNNRRPSDTHKSIPPPSDENRGLQLSPEPGFEGFDKISGQNSAHILPTFVDKTEEGLVFGDNLDSDIDLKKTSSKVTSPDIAGVPTFSSESITLASNSSAATLFPSVSANDLTTSDQTSMIYPEIVSDLQTASNQDYPYSITPVSDPLKRCEALDLYYFGVCALCMLKPTLLKDEKKLAQIRQDPEKAMDYFTKLGKSRRVSSNMTKFITKCLNAFDYSEGTGVGKGKIALKASDLLKDKALFEIRPLKLMAAQILMETNEGVGDEFNEGLMTPQDETVMAETTFGMKDERETSVDVDCDDQKAVSEGGKDIKQWKWKEIMDLILELETQKHRNAEAAKEVKLRKREEEKKRENNPNEKLKPEDAKRIATSTSQNKSTTNQKPGQKSSNQKLKTTTKAKDPRNLAKIKLEDFNLHKYMEDVRQGHHGIHRVNPRNNERRTDNDHYADETNSMISDARNPGETLGSILDTNDSMTQSMNEKLVGKGVGRGKNLLEDDEEAGGPKQDNKETSNTVDDAGAHGTDSVAKEGGGGRNLDKEKAKKEEKKVYPIEKRPLELCQITFKNKNVEENKNNADTGSVVSETGTLAATEFPEKENNSPEHRRDENDEKLGQRRNSTPDQNQHRQNSANNQVNTTQAHSQTKTHNQVQTHIQPQNQPKNQPQNLPQNQPQNQQQPTNSLSNHTSNIAYDVEINITFRGGFERKLKTAVEKTEKGIEIARELVSLGFISHNDTKQLSTIYNHAWQKAFGEIDNGIGSTDVKDLIKENYLKMQRDQEKEIEKRVLEKMQGVKVGVVAK